MTTDGLNAFSLTGQRALVTGASRGLGTAIAAALAAAGADVVLHGSTDAPTSVAARIAAETGRRTYAVAADLRQPDAAARLMADAIAAAGQIDILVNNAGIIRRAPAAEYRDEDWDDVIAVNLTSVFKLCRVAAVPMLERGHGKIINIASLLSFQGGIRVPAYTAAKAGVAHLTQALANEWASRGINVNAIAPGYMLTDNTTALAADPVRSAQISERIPAGRWGQPADLGGAAVFLASRASDYVHGHILVVDGGWMGR